MDKLIDILLSIDVSVVFTRSEDNAIYSGSTEEFYILVDPTSEYNLDMLLKHEFIHALQHEYARTDVLPFPLHIWRYIKPPACFVQRAVKEYKYRYKNEPICLIELQAMALETMPYEVLIEIYKYIINN